MLNKVILIGRLTKDPDVKSLPTGVSVTTFTIAVNRNYTNQQGEREADFIQIVTWRQLAETCGKYLNKGKQVAVSGRLQTRTYDTPEGQRRYITEVVADEVQFLDKMGDATERERDNNPYYNQGQGNSPSRESAAFSPIEDDDELPF